METGPLATNEETLAEQNHSSWSILDLSLWNSQQPQDGSHFTWWPLFWNCLFSICAFFITSKAIPGFVGIFIQAGFFGIDMSKKDKTIKVYVQLVQLVILPSGAVLLTNDVTYLVCYVSALRDVIGR